MKQVKVLNHGLNWNQLRLELVAIVPVQYLRTQIVVCRAVRGCTIKVSRRIDDQNQEQVLMSAMADSLCKRTRPVRLYFIGW